MSATVPVIFNDADIDYFDLRKHLVELYGQEKLENLVISHCNILNCPPYAMQSRCNCREQQIETRRIVVCNHDKHIFGYKQVVNVKIEYCNFMPIDFGEE